MKKMREKMDNKRKTLLSVLFIFFLCMSVTKLSFAQTEPSLTATPNDSNITQVVGSGFNGSETVSLKIMNATGGEVYVFPENVSTDVDGSFSGIVIVPTSIHGTFNMTAATSSVSLFIEFTVPDLTGPQGAQGATGTTGATGSAGPEGEAGAGADISVIYGSYGLAIFALLLSCLALVKKSR